MIWWLVALMSALCLVVSVGRTWWRERGLTERVRREEAAKTAAARRDYRDAEIRRLQRNWALHDQAMDPKRTPLTLQQVAAMWDESYPGEQR